MKLFAIADLSLLILGIEFFDNVRLITGIKKKKKKKKEEEEEEEEKENGISSTNKNKVDGEVLVSRPIVGLCKVSLEKILLV
jgi:hypothetical protein